MGVRVGLLLLLVLGISWLNNVDARNLVTSDVLAKQVNYKQSKNDAEAFQADAKDDRFCTLCEQYTSLAVDYFGDNKTQREIIGTLHTACSHTHGFKHECTTLVDYYAPLFFLEISRIEPAELCSKMNLCDMAFASEEVCTLCHEAVAEVLDKLDDPDIQLEIIQILQKVCDKSDQYAKQCKRLVFEYGPLIMANAEKFLVQNDLCTTLHVCKTSTGGNEVASSSLLAES